jgi:surfactin synthase thioesterase subunit
MKAILLHHAGGDKYAWRAYQELLSPGFDTIALELPGRGDRFGEKLLNSMEEMAEDIYGQMLTHINEPYILVGKSMGALLVYLVMVKLKEKYLRLPSYVFLGSRKCPASYHNDDPIFNKSTPEFWEGVKVYGGLPEALLNHDELKELFEPILRADFCALETYRHGEEVKFNIPATVMYGRQDRVTAEELGSWQQYFVPPIDIFAFASGHFFMYDQAEEITALIKEKLHGAG